MKIAPSSVRSLLTFDLIVYPVEAVRLTLYNYQRADDKIFVCKFSKNVKSKLYHIQNSTTRGQTV